MQVSIAAACLADPGALDADDRYAVWKVAPEPGCIVQGSELGFDHVGLELNSRRSSAC